MRRGTAVFGSERLERSSDGLPESNSDIMLSRRHWKDRESISCKCRATKRIMFPNFKRDLRPTLRALKFILNVNWMAPDVRTAGIRRSVHLSLTFIFPIHEIPVLCYCDPPAAKSTVLKSGGSKKASKKERVSRLRHEKNDEKVKRIS
jgi:hypothetical protein